MIVCKNKRLELCFDPNNGVLRRITDLKKKCVLAENTGEEAFLLEWEQTVFSSAFASFTYSQQEEGLEFCWKIEENVSVQAKVKSRADAFAFTAAVINKSEKTVCSLEYPLIDGLQNLSGEDAYAAHSFATGFLVQAPQKAFAKEGDGFRYMPYPESFSGASMQFFSCYTEGKSGLYFAAYDDKFHHKWLNFYQHGNGLRASQIFGYEDVGPGKPVQADWDFVVQATEGRDWFEACDLYKEWALKQSWCAKGRMVEVPEAQKAKWLLEDTGAATFGINGKHDRTKWIRKYREAVGAPIFHVTGPDWTRVPQSYGSGVPGGYDDWFPTCFSRENVDVWKELGDRFAPFEFDFLVDINKADKEKIKKSLQKWPEKPKSCDKYEFHMLCPLCEYTQNLHVERDRRVVRESGADAMYYDISANNILKTCMEESHGHPVGAGREMTEAYRNIYRDTKDALSKDSGKYVPLGTEMMNECFLDVLDYYQARANAQPCSALETWPYRELIQENRAWVIPMFQYVYSGYGAVRLDGWGKLVREGGTLIYHTIAKTYLWGGLFEINSEYSPMEVIDEGGENPSEEHYCSYEPRNYRFDEAIAAYLAKFAALRTGRYGKFLAYGEMQHSPRLACEETEFSYYQYNHGHSKEQNSRGTVYRKSVLSEAYRLNGETVILIANVTDRPQKVQLTTPLLGQAETCGVCRDYAAKQTEEEVVDAKTLGKLELKPYQLVVIHSVS